jgi:hypothetical protein
MGWEAHAARVEEMGNAYRVIVGKPEGRRLLGRPRHRLNDNIKMDLKEIFVRWIHVAQDRDQ